MSQTRIMETTERDATRAVKEVHADADRERMRAYRVSKECNDSIDEKFSMIKSYDVGDLLYVLRDIEENPTKYDESVIKGVVGRLYDMGIMCI